MDKETFLAVGGVVLMSALVVAIGWGWVWNIVKLCAMNMDTFSGMLLARAVGIFVAPLGVVLGYL